MFDFSKRETKVVILGTLFALLFLSHQFMIKPVFEKKDNFTRILNEKKTGVKEMLLLQKEFDPKFNPDSDHFFIPDQRDEKFSLFSFLNQKAQQSGIKKNVVYMKPLTKKNSNTLYTIETVKIKLNKVYFKALLDFIYSIESSHKGVMIPSLSVSKPEKGKTKLDVIIEVNAFMKKEKTQK